MEEERALTLLQKAESGCLSSHELRWLERWLRAEDDGWLQRLLRGEAVRRKAPVALGDRVLECLSRGRRGDNLEILDSE